MDTVGSRVNQFGYWVYRLLCVNALWVGFALLGLGVLGIFPATQALFAVIRKWLMNKDVKLVKDFYYFYRKDFWKSNALGYIFLVIAAILWIDFRYFMSITDFMMFVLGHVMLLLFVFTLLSLLIVFTIYSHFQLTFYQYVKYALLYPFTHLARMILIVIAFTLFYFILTQFSGLIFFLGISFPCYILMRVLFPTFERKSQQEGEKGLFQSQKDKSIYY